MLQRAMVSVIVAAILQLRCSTPALKADMLPAQGEIQSTTTTPAKKRPRTPAFEFFARFAVVVGKQKSDVVKLVGPPRRTADNPNWTIVEYRYYAPSIFNLMLDVIVSKESGVASSLKYDDATSGQQRARLDELFDFCGIKDSEREGMVWAKSPLGYTPNQQEYRFEIPWKSGVIYGMATGKQSYVKGSRKFNVDLNRWEVLWTKGAIPYEEIGLEYVWVYSVPNKFSAEYVKVVGQKHTELPKTVIESPGY